MCLGSRSNETIYMRPLSVEDAVWELLSEHKSSEVALSLSRDFSCESQTFTLLLRQIAYRLYHYSRGACKLQIFGDVR